MEYRQSANTRLSQLREEQKSGQEQLAQLEQRSDELRKTMLRISGAIQVLEELESQHADSK